MIPRRRARNNAKSVATGDGRCVCARTGRAWLRDYPANDGRKSRITSIRPCGIGGRRCGLASWPSYPADWLRCSTAGADRSRSRCPSAVTALAACEHRPSSGGGERSANRLRTRCGRAYNRYGDKCQGYSPHSTNPPVAPHSMRGSAFLLRSGPARQRGPVSSTGRRRSLGWFTDGQLWVDWVGHNASRFQSLCWTPDAIFDSETRYNAAFADEKSCIEPTIASVPRLKSRIRIEVLIGELSPSLVLGRILDSRIHL